MNYSVLSYGAKSDGTTKDHPAIQSAIDACHAAGGGRVSLPPGRYLCGTLWLKSGVELHLEHGAEIIASPDRADYNEDDVFPENVVAAQERVTPRHLIIAYQQTNIAITGSGTINGNSMAFFLPLPEEHRPASRYHIRWHYPIREWRPGQMIYFCLCQKVRVSGVELLNAPYWTLFLHGCDDVFLHGLRIENPPATPNGDGIDIDCCRSVTVSDCIIRSGDDCITLRGNAARLGERGQPCEDITVQNCVLSTPCNAIRIGVGNGLIRRATFTNLVIKESGTGISLISNYLGIPGNGAAIRQIHFSHLVLDVLIPFSIGNGKNPRPGSGIADISFAHIHGTAKAAGQLLGDRELPLRRFTFTEFHLCFEGGSTNTSFQEALPEPVSQFGYYGGDDTPALPFGIYATFLQEFRFTGVHLRWEEPAPVWQSAIRVDHASGLYFHDTTLRQPQATGAGIQCRHVTGVRMEGCRAEPATDIFLLVDPASAPQVTCHGNAMEEAKSAIQVSTLPFSDHREAAPLP